MNSRRTLLHYTVAYFSAVLIALSILTPAWAGEYFEKDGVALRGHDPVAYFSENKPVKGWPEYKAEHKGSIFHFASKANRDAFVAEPNKYAPQYGGFCAFGMSNGYKAATDPAAFRVVDGKLYLNYNRDVQAMWSADIAEFVVKADGHWPTASSQTKVID